MMFSYRPIPRPQLVSTSGRIPASAADQSFYRAVYRFLPWQRHLRYLLAALGLHVTRDNVASTDFAAGLDTRVTEIDLPKCRALWMEPSAEKVATSKDPDLVVLQLHGGSYQRRLRAWHGRATHYYSAAARGAKVLSVDYRTAPENPFPAALEDAWDGYRWLRTQGYADSQIVLAGDSAGGGLALALAMQLRDYEQTKAAAMLLFSPWTDLAGAGASYYLNRHRDAIFRPLDRSEGRPQGDVYAGEKDLRDPLISPAYGELHDLPPTLITVGSDEILLSDSLRVAAAMKRAGTTVELGVYDALFHAQAIALPQRPLSKKIWYRVRTFLDGLN